MLNFTIDAKDPHSKARTGTIETSRGKVKTPLFMPVSTAGSVKAILPRDLTGAGFNIFISNTYHLYLRPGSDVIKSQGGLHKFVGWNGHIATDSGGFQVHSLAALKKLSENGVEFASHIDGSRHFFTPEKVVNIQKDLGSDFMMQLDECVSLPNEDEYVLNSTNLSLRWAERSQIEFKKVCDERQTLFGIVQGGVSEEFRKVSAKGLCELDFDAYSIGGLSVGEAKEDMYRIAELTAKLLPTNKPRYLMGVGTPLDLVECVRFGIDMFDCVMPTRNARNGTLFTSKGTVNIKNNKYLKDNSPLDENCACYTCQNFSKSYLRHLFMAKEISACILNSLHNLHYYSGLIKKIQQNIEFKNFDNFYKEFKKCL
ncbi:MAG: tRNA guanosine(34) transglycosylase Tgt [Pseudomonadota bacterium]